MMRRLALALLLAVPAFAQVRETIEVSITNLDVVVTDGKGNRIRGLRKEDFEVLENGQPREITNFTEYSVTTSSPATAAAAAPESGAPAAAQVAVTPPRRIMILFDAKSLTPTVRRQSAAAAASFIDAHVRPSDKVAIAVLSQQFTPRTDWIGDKAELKRVVGQIANETFAATVAEERKRAEDRIEYLIEVAASTEGNDRTTPPSFEELMKVARNFAEFSLQDTRFTVSLLSTVVTQLGKFPEKKALVFIGEGLDARPGWEIFQMLENLKSGARHSAGLTLMLNRNNTSKLGSPLIEAGRYSAASVFASLATTAYRSGVPIYAINPGTNEDISDVVERYGSPPDRQQDFAKFASKFIGYDLVATYSGGAAFVGQRADLALSAVAADLGGYYSIGFRAAAPPRDAGTIRVRVKRAGNHNVRASLATAAPVEVADSITEAVTAHHVLEPQTNDLEIALDSDEPVAEGDKQKIKVHVLIPVRNLDLVRQGNELTGGFDVYLSISDGKAYFSPVNKQTHQIRWPAAEVSQDDERTMKYTIDVTLEQGASLISVGVVDHRSKKTGFERLEL